MIALPSAIPSEPARLDLDLMAARRASLVWAYVSPSGLRIAGTGNRAAAAPVGPRLQVALDSLMTLAQYNQADDTLSISGRARHNLREGTNAWLVYDELRTSARGGSAPAAAESRALMLKLNHTFLP